jgi:hypothetical protein
MAGCLGGPQVGDSDGNSGGGGGGGTPSNRRVVLAPKSGEGGIRLVDSANPGSATVIESGNVAPIAVAARRTRDANGVFSDARSEFVVYEKDGKILKVDLATSANATAGVQVSSELEACGAGTLYHNDPDAGLAMYLYTSAGSDGACGTNDDARRAVRLSMSSTDTPLTLPSAETLVSDLTGGTGALAGWLMFNGTTLSRYDVGFTNRQAVTGGGAITNDDAPKTRDANGVLFELGNDLRYYSLSDNTLGDPIHSKAPAAQFGVYRQDATRTYFTEFDTQTRIRSIPTAGGPVILIAQEAGNTSNSLALTTNRVIYQQPDGSVRSVAKDGTQGLTLRAPAAGASLAFAVINSAVVIIESSPQPALSIHAEASNTPIGSNRSNTALVGFTNASSGNVFGANLSKIIAVQRLSNASTDASGALISLDPSSAVEINLGSLSAEDVSFRTDALQAGDFTTSFSLSAAGGALQRLFSLSAATASSLRVLQ